MKQPEPRVVSDKPNESIASIRNHHGVLLGRRIEIPGYFSLIIKIPDHPHGYVVAGRTLTIQMFGVVTKPLHGQDVELMAVEVHRMRDVPGKAFIDEEDLDDIVEVHLVHVVALTEAGWAMLVSVQIVLTAEHVFVNVPLLS